MLLIHSIFIFLACFFLGYNFGWSVFQYDELRLLQLVITVFAFAALIFKKSLQVNYFSLILFFLIFFNFSKFNIFNLQDILVLISLPILVYSLSQNFNEALRNHKVYYQHLLFLIVIFATIPCLFVFLSIRNFINEGVWYDWQMNSGNIRIYDSTIIPIVFLAFYLKSIYYKYIQKNYFLIIFLISLGLWFDGARAVFLSIIVGLIVVVLCAKECRRVVFVTMVSILISFLIYHLTYCFYNKMNNVDTVLNIVRDSSSGRFELWSFTYKNWLHHPFKGLGGGYLATTTYPLNHLHNFYLRLIFEWGLFGGGYLCWIIYNIQKLFFSKSVHIVLKSGICAIVIDAFFSGNLIYPASQLSIVLFLSIAFSQYQVCLNTKYKYIFLARFLLLLWFVLYFYILFNYFYQDLMCYGCESSKDVLAPGFWYYGKSEHIIHHSVIQ